MDKWVRPIGRADWDALQCARRARSESDESIPLSPPEQKRAPMGPIFVLVKKEVDSRILVRQNAQAVF